MCQHRKTASKDFSRKTLNALKKKGIFIYSTTFLPDEQGCFLNGVRGYNLNDNGCGRIRTYLEVLKIAEE